MKHARPPSAIHVDFDHLTTSTEIILASDRFKALIVFTSIYGIGPNTARRLYSLGLRTIADLEVYYGVESSDAPPTELLEVELQRKHSRSWRGKGQVDEAERRGDVGNYGGEKGEGDEGLGDSWIKVALELREDLAIRCVRSLRVWAPETRWLTVKAGYRVQRWRR